MANSDQNKSSTAIVYLRTASTEQADHSAALERQWDVCKDYARERGLRIVGTYTDAGVSGLSPRRPALDSIMDELPLGRTCYLITADETRLSRSIALQLALELQLGRYGVKLVVASQADITSLN